MNEERIYLTDYVEKMRTAYRQARAGFEIYANALAKEQENWKKELQRGWNDATQRKNDHEKHERTERELKGRLETLTREAKAEFDEIINEANGVFDRHFRATPESIDEKGLALLNSGVLSKKELMALADEYPEYGYSYCSCEECGYYKGCKDCCSADMCSKSEKEKYKDK